MPHSLASLHVIYSANAYDTYNTIFCSGTHHIEEIRNRDRMLRQPERYCPAVGYGKMDLLRSQWEAWKQDQHEGNTERPVVLIAPSWGQDNIIDSIGGKLIDALLDDGYQVVLRPHPTLLEHSTVLAKLQKKHKVNPLVVFETISTQESLFYADIMISDYSGVAYEFTFLRELPVLFIDVSPKIINQDWESFGVEPLEWFLREQVGRIALPDDVGKIIENIEWLLQNIEYYRETIIEARNKYMFNHENCGQVAVLELEKLVRSSVNEKT